MKTASVHPHPAAPSKPPTGVQRRKASATAPPRGSTACADGSQAATSEGKTTLCCGRAGCEEDTLPYRVHPSLLVGDVQLEQHTTCRNCWLFLQRCLMGDKQRHQGCLNGPCEKHLQVLRSWNLPHGLQFKVVQVARLRDAGAPPVSARAKRRRGDSYRASARTNASHDDMEAIGGRQRVGGGLKRPRYLDHTQCAAAGAGGGRFAPARTATACTVTLSERGKGLAPSNPLPRAGTGGLVPDTRHLVPRCFQRDPGSEEMAAPEPEGGSRYASDMSSTGSASPTSDAVESSHHHYTATRHRQAHATTHGAHANVCTCGPCPVHGARHIATGSTLPAVTDFNSSDAKVTGRHDPSGGRGHGHGRVGAGASPSDAQATAAELDRVMNVLGVDGPAV